MSTLWTEKYRPRSIDEFAAPPHIKSFLRHSLAHGFPHLLLYGPPGTGKTTFAHLLAGDTFLELNASDERGIGTIRSTIKTYASSISSSNVIILDECELLTPDAQHCLRRIIEDYAQTRFIFITNYICKIIAPLRSRLLKLKFDAFDTSAVLERIARSEGMRLGAADTLYRHCGGDLRRAIVALQSIAPLESYDLEEVLGIIKEDVVQDFWRVAPLSQEAFVSAFVQNSYSLGQLVHQLAVSPRGSDRQKAELALALSMVEGRSVVGCSEEILARLLCCSKIEIYRGTEHGARGDKRRKRREGKDRQASGGEEAQHSALFAERRREKQGRARDAHRKAVKKHGMRGRKAASRCTMNVAGVAGADDIEREILEKGTVKDKIDTLTLLVARDPSNDGAFSMLLDMCSGQRNDVIFYILKNATDLILNGFFPLDKKRLKRALEEHARNKFIQDKVLRLVHALLKKGILVGDILHIFVNRLGAKECSFVMAELETMYHRSKEAVLKELRTFYYKYSDLRGRNNVMKLLNAVCGEECLGFFVEVFNGLAVDGKSTQDEKLVERSVSGLYKLLVLGREQDADGCSAGGEGAPVLDTARLVRCCKKRKIAAMALSVLSRVSGTAFMETLLGTLARASLGDQAEFLNMIYSTVKENKPLVAERLLCTALHMNHEFVCGAVVLMKAFGVRLARVEALLARHFSPAVRYLLAEETSVDPFRSEDFQKLESIATTYFAEAQGLCGDVHAQ
ncbi:UNVERIFIED_CONTAM: hypothetical protein PYX00_011673 [Menopon gallinae]|uniref:AAA+ ATPase domain-containing protein n=1 Tax=Menopon gallinae TaxID=328185 RepID=A0AAW2H8F4_9NEOP